MIKDIIDCVIIGYYETPFTDYVDFARSMQKQSGIYEELKTNSILLDGKRISYETLFNKTISSVTGKDFILSAFDVPNLAVHYLANYLKKRNFNIAQVNYINKEKDKLIELLKTEPKAVAITTTYYVDQAPIIELVKLVREYSPVTKIIVGGPFIFSLSSHQSQLAQDFIFNNIEADLYIIDNQGEATLNKVLDQLKKGKEEFDHIPNLAIKKSDKILRTERIVEQNDLNQDYINWHFFNSEKISNAIYMRTSRGCPYSCAFCTYHEIGGDFEQTDLTVIEKELKILQEKGITHLMFVDDTFNIPVSRLKKFCEILLKNNYQFKWISYLRCSNYDDEMFDLMEQSGCVGVILGIESGDQMILENMNKRVKVEDLKWTIQQLNKRNIPSGASLFIGFPGETEETVNNTIEFLKEVKPTYLMMQLYYHYDYTPINKRKEELGINGGGYSWSHNTMNWKEAAEHVKRVYKSCDYSIITPLYGFDLWTMQYWRSIGFSDEVLNKFLRIAHKMLVETLDDDDKDFSHYKKELNLIFKEIDIEKIIL